MSILLNVFLLLLLVAAAPAHAQTTRTSGVVVDARTGRPLAGVLVSVEGLTLFVETDGEGRFELDVPNGTHTLSVSLVGYVFLRQPLEAAGGTTSPLRIELAEGAGGIAEHVRVDATAPSDAGAAPAGATLHGRELQALRGVVLDDPFRALHAVPSVAATDDFYSEFAVRGLGFRYVGVSVDGIPSQYLMHSVHGVTDGGSITMLNSDAVASLSLAPGSYPQRFGRRIGAHVDVATREGDRTRLRTRVGLSGTSASVLGEGPLASSRGSWLVSARRSYLDLILKRIDDDNSVAFGFTDLQGKVVFDLAPKHQLQALAVFGASKFTEDPEDLGANDEARVSGRAWLSGLTWRYTPTATVVLTQRVFATGLTYENVNAAGDVLDDSGSHEIGWRGDATIAPRRGWLLELGGDAQLLSGRHAMRRALNDGTALFTLSDYRQRGRAASAYTQLTMQPVPRVSVTPGVRVDRWSPTDASTASPWLNVDVRVTSSTRVRAGGGTYRQFPLLGQVHGIRGGGAALRPETADHIDVGVIQSVPRAATVQVTWFARNERDVLWTPGSEPRRLPDGSVMFGRGDARWTNALSGRARGVEVVLRRDAPAGLSGWAGYAYTRHRQTVAATRESFWSDMDQRHALSLFGHYRLTNRTSVGAKFRYGSNYPRVGYVAEQPPPAGAPPLFGGEAPLFFGLSDTRNALRLPAYARLDVRADRTFTWSGRRITLFVEVANTLNRANLRNVPYGVDRSGRVFGGTDTLLPVLPSAGFVIEF